MKDKEVPMRISGLILASTIALGLFAALFGAFAPLSGTIETVLDQEPRGAAVAGVKGNAWGVRHVLD
jgi:hypothetical protein